MTPSAATTAAPSLGPVSTGAARKPRHVWTNFSLHCVAHFFIDVYSAALSAFQPLLVRALDISLTQAGILGGTLSFASSVTQPLYGYLSDRYHTRLFTALAPAVAGIGISAIGWAPSFGWLLLLVLMGGAGIASFHPQGSARATLGLDENRGRWMAIFISSGTLGLAMGPALFTFLLTRFGLGGGAWGMLPGVLMTILLLIYLREPEAAPAQVRQRTTWAPLRAQWRPLAILYTLVFIRSILQVSYAQFLPLYLTRERGFGLPQASWTLTAYLAAGSLGGFVGGNLADRFGGRVVILASMVLCLPALALFFFAPHPAVAMAGLVAGGAALLFTIPVNVTMAQELAPENVGVISALMMGFSWGMAGLIFVPLTGWVGEHYSLHTALASLLIFPVFGALLTPMLKRYGCR